MKSSAINPSLEELKKLASGYTLAPVYKTVKTDKTPMALLEAARASSHRLFMLERTHRDSSEASVYDRYSVICFAPAFTVSCLNKEITFTAGQSSFSFPAADPISFLEGLIDQNKAPRIAGLPPFTGGFAGYFSYEFIRLAEPSCRFSAPNKEGYKDFEFQFYDRVCVYDREEKSVLLVCNLNAADLTRSYGEAAAALEQMERTLFSSNAGQSAVQPLQLTGAFTPIYPKERYMTMVEKAKALIKEGEVAQIVLTNGQQAKAEGDLISTFGVLRDTDPTRYMCYYSSDDAQAVMASPEPLALLQNGSVMTERLAGSYARGKTPSDDEAQAKALRQDAKAINEHNMLVDDSRNEFGYLCKLGGVRVEGYLNVVRCAKVMHLGSTVVGELKAGVTALDVLRTITPSGAVSGAPKVRACEVINEIEQERRGIYGSSFGYIALNGDADFFAFIHSAFLKNGTLTVRAGGGIVIDSVPEEEYEECQFKAAAMLNAIKLSAQKEAAL